MDKLQLLQTISFGQRVAEDETDTLSTYFVETDQWQRLFRGDIDVVYGPKGSGKSALYSLLLSKDTHLFDRGIVLVAAENPRGAPAFRDLTIDPPASEREFIGLWKLYIASLLHDVLAEYNITNSAADQLGQALEREGLVKGKRTLSGLLKATQDYLRRSMRPQSLEGGIEIDPLTQFPKGISGKIVFAEPGVEAEPETQSVDHLLELASKALEGDAVAAWVLLDRLDVAFADDPDLESSALRALFRVYLDVGIYPSIKLKIFLRTDIWSRITTKGFREASHITRSVTLKWDSASLLNLVVRRLLHNQEIQDAFGVSEEVSRQPVGEQEAFFYRVCPAQVDEGPNKPKTFDWVLSRTRDGTRANTPRELVHFLNSLREEQVKLFEIGEVPPVDERLFVRSAFKQALVMVSRTRLEQTIYAEYPDEVQWLEKLRGAKTLQKPDTLAERWNVSREEAVSKASYLASIGLFETRGTQADPEFWVPFLYRDALDLVQGAAEV